MFKESSLTFLKIQYKNNGINGMGQISLWNMIYLIKWNSTFYHLSIQHWVWVESSEKCIGYTVFGVAYTVPWIAVIAIRCTLAEK